MKTKFFFYFIYSTLIVITLSSCKSPLSNNINDPVTLIEKYFASKTWQERLMYVLDSASTKPLMEKYYENSDFSDLPTFKDIKQINQNPDFILPDSVILMSITASWKNAFGGEISEQFYYYLVKTGNGLKIDWPSSIGYNSLSLDVYKATKPTDIKTFKLTCKLSDYYNFGYFDSDDKYYSIDCETSENGSYSSIYGYVQKESEDGKKMFEILKDGKSHKMTLALQYDYRSEGNSEIATIKKYLTAGWYNPVSSIASQEPDILRTYIFNQQGIARQTYIGFPESPNSGMKTIIEFTFDEDQIVETRTSFFNDAPINEISTVCYITDSIYSVSAGIHEIKDSDVYMAEEVVKDVVKLPQTNQKNIWSYTDYRDSTKFYYGSEFCKVQFQGQMVNAIKVTEKNSEFKSITTYRYYLKDIGFFKEDQEDKTGKIITTLQLED
jgi:hypothetical protein